MRLLKPIPDLGPCEGRWVTSFGAHRGCTYRASESFEPPCGHVHLLCATCVYALERGMGTWDDASDLLLSDARSARLATSEPVPAFPVSSSLGLAAGSFPRGSRHPRRHAESVPAHVALVGVSALAALILALGPAPAVVAPTTVATTVILYAIASRGVLHR